MAPLRWDVALGALVLFIVTGAFMISGAAVLFPLETRFEGWNLLTHQAHVWRQIHPSLVWIYYVCILAALWGTLQALPEIYARVAQEFLSARWPDRTWEYQAIKRVICLYIFATTMLIVWNNIPFDILTPDRRLPHRQSGHCHDDGGSHLSQFQTTRLLPHPRMGPHRRSALDRGPDRLLRRQRLGDCWENWRAN